ncbi:MAG TPA: Calx-beta domain-containing protein [Pyrinomonadaceae bacterium]
MKRNYRNRIVAAFLLAGLACWLVATGAQANDNVTELSARLTGASINGVAPGGTAEYEVKVDGNREFKVTVSSVNLPAGTVLSVLVDNSQVGQLSVNSLGGGQFEVETKDGQTVPVVNSNSTVVVRQGTTTILSGSFAASPNPTPSPSPSPSASPSPSPSPGGEMEISAPLSGPAIGGITPTGRAKFELENEDSGLTRKLEIKVRDVNLPAGTVFNVLVDGATVGQLTLRTSGRGEIELFGSSVPATQAGTTVEVRQGNMPILSGVFPASPGPTPSPSPSPNPTPSPSPNIGNCSIRLSAPNYSVDEGAGSVTITVLRACTQPGISRVDYETEDHGTASQRSDYTDTSGRLVFAAGETSKTFNVLITDDSLVEQPETFVVKLEDTEDTATLANPSEAIVTINSNDAAATASNPLEQAQFFVKQHYADFLNRTADQGGLDYWSSQIAQCGTDDNCVRLRRIAVSAAFFVETEFQETGNFVYRMYRATYGRKPTFNEFMPDRSRFFGSTNFAQSKVAFADDWVTRPSFRAEYPETMIADQFVNKLFDAAGLAPFAAERQQQIAAMNNGKTRAEVLRDVVEIQAFKDREYNAAFVLMQYFGYLRREPDAGGYQFWLDVLNNRVPGNYRSMVCAFITSSEMQGRFDLNIDRTNSECGP